ncbi:MAG: nucleotidyltransferase family protein [Candidatus Cloacimonetes bacterium]|nr:nucleotidyltransferase family protein [Candidatus Cloacimonadota bacterium]
MQEIQDWFVSINTEHTRKEITGKEIPALLTYLKTNKISFIDLYKRQNMADSALLKEKSFLHCLEHEREKLRQWYDEFVPLREAWESAGIEYIFHKSLGEFPHLSDNLDVLVQTGSFRKAGEILLRNGYINLRNIQEPHKEFYRKFEGDHALVPIHLHERVCWIVPYEDKDHIWQNFRISGKDPLIRFPSGEDSLLVLTAHFFLEDHLIRMKDILELRYLTKNNSLNWDKVMEMAEKSSWMISLATALVITDTIHERIFRERLIPAHVKQKCKQVIEKHPWIIKVLHGGLLHKKIILPLNLPHFWVRRHSSLRILHDHHLGNTWQRWQIVLSNSLDGIIHNKMKIRSQPPFFLAVSGVDGSGKTIHLQTLQNIMTNCGLKSTLLWSRAGSFPMVNFILRMKKRKDNRGKDKEQDQAGVNYSSGFLLSLFRWGNILEGILYYFFKITLLLWKGRLVMSDRFVADAIVDLEFLGKKSNLNRKLYRFFSFLTPCPDQRIIITTAIDNILQRKPEERADELKSRMILYDRLKEIDTFVVVDNNRDFATVNKELTEMVLQKYYARYPEKYRNYRVISFRYA